MQNSCSPNARGISRIARPLPVWNTYGPGRLLVLLWGPLLSIDPLLDTLKHDPAWPPVLLTLAILALFAAAVLTAYSHRRHAAGEIIALLGGQVVLTVLAAVVYGPHWYTMFTLLALGIGALLPPLSAPPTAFTLTVIASGVVWLRDQDWTTTWTLALTLLLTWFSTYSLHRLLSVAAELDATREELARQAVDRERLRFARDLHDLLGHTLSVIVVKAQAVRRLLPGDIAAAAEHVSDIETIGRQALVEVREAVAGYRDIDITGELDRATLALSAAGIAMTVEQTGEPVPVRIDTLFGWVIREGVTNVIRHSGATRCVIAIEAGDRIARLMVTDDGRGAATTEGSGIEGLRERTLLEQGRLTVTDSPTGFVLTAEVPLWKEAKTG